MGRRMAAVRAMARCSPSRPMARVLRTCIVSRQALVLLVPTVTELVLAVALLLVAAWFYRATPSMGQRKVAAVRALARCSGSTLTGRVLRTCIVLRQHLLLIIPTATELIRWAI